MLTEDLHSAQSVYKEVNGFVIQKDVLSNLTSEDNGRLVEKYPIWISCELKD